MVAITHTAVTTNPWTPTLRSFFLPKPFIEFSLIILNLFLCVWMAQSLSEHLPPVLSLSPVLLVSTASKEGAAELVVLMESPLCSCQPTVTRLSIVPLITCVNITFAASLGEWVRLFSAVNCCSCSCRCEFVLTIINRSTNYFIFVCDAIVHVSHCFRLAFPIRCARCVCTELLPLNNRKPFG